MLRTIALLLVIMWLLGMVSSNTIGGFIHLLLVLAIISVLLDIIQSRGAVLRTNGGSAPNAGRRRRRR